MRKLKIGITCYPTVGGSGVIATELGKLLAERGHEIHFITSSVPFRLKKIYPNVFFHGVEVNNYSVFQYPPYDIALASKMADVIKEEKLDVLHVHYAIPHAICAVLAREMSGENFGIVTTLHGTDITVLGQDSTMAQAIKYAIEKSDIVTAVSNSLKEQTYELIQPAKEIETIYNFVDESVFRPIDVGNLKEQFGIRHNERVLIHASNFRKIKNLPDIVNTFIKVRDQIPAKLLLVGDGPEKHRVMDLVKECPYKKDILFLGKQENVEQLFAISDLMLLLSEKESFGLVLLEAMACGVPGIGTATGGIPEVIEHGVNGYLVQLGDTTTAAEYAIDLLTNDDKLIEFREAAISASSGKFNSKLIIDQYEQLYERLAVLRV
ncbi:N-acetyl-alpha-D-glucosaminyl L-malate synthase BshA [Ureibacillus sp. MALMAid1270]|uniref:N-acetyl-alpha-D-glucosaminyl L-malate synthase BshA n=1 Tax=Ureibacillus sp. MALMAid1270 TaxID=3411629 RepID=UPI003BA7B45D